MREKRMNVDKVRDINIDGVRTFLFQKNNNLRITEFTEENDTKFKKFVTKEILYGVLIFIATVVLVIGNFYLFKHLDRLLSSDGTAPMSSERFALRSLSVLFFVITALILLSIVAKISTHNDFSVVSKISSLFSMLSKTGRDKAYAELNKDEYLLIYAEDRYGVNSFKALNKNFDEFSDDELSNFIKNIKEQMRNHSRINKIKKIVSKNEADEFILKDLKNKKQELEQRDEELSGSILNFLSVVKASEKAKANEEAIAVLSA